MGKEPESFVVLVLARLMAGFPSHSGHLASIAERIMMQSDVASALMTDRML